MYVHVGTVSKIHKNTVHGNSLRKKATIIQVTTMLATSKNVLFPGHIHLLTTSTDDPSLAGARAINQLQGVRSSVPVVSRLL